MVGETISHYRVLKKIGEGGMGEVYLAEDTSLERKVALKFLPVGLQTDPVAHKRFIREAKSAAAIDHPYICHIHEVSQTDDGQDFIVMEYVQGQTLKDRLEQGKLPIKEALQIGSEVAEALEEAHSNGVIHRDLKPSNIMVTPSGHAKVLDFGLAKRVTRDKEDLTSVLTREGTTLGTLAYMSPEQLRGSTVDTRSDVFSMGVMLYEMLTGVHPFRTGTQAETVNAILSEHPSILTRYVEGVPDLLQHTIKKMLAKQPGERYQTVHEIRTNLTKVMEEITSPTPLAAQEKKRRSWLVGAVSATVTIFFLALIWFYFLAPSAQPVSAPLVAFPVTSEMGCESYPNLSPDGKRVAYVQGEWRGDILVRQVAAEGGKPLRLTSSGQDLSPVWSPDGETVAFLRRLDEQKYTVHTVPGFTGLERQWADISMPKWPISPCLAWTPDGSSLLVAGYPEFDESPGLFLLSLETREMRRLTTTPKDDHADFAAVVSSDGHTLAFIRSTGLYHGDIYTLGFSDEMEPIGEPKRLTFAAEMMRGLTWNPEGEEIIYSSGSWPKFRLWRIQTEGQVTREALEFAGTSAMRPTVSRVGNRLIYEQNLSDTNMYQMDLDVSGKPLGLAKIFQSSSRSDNTGDYSPDGSKVVFNSNRGGTLELYICDRDGSNVIPLTSFGGPSVYFSRWSPNGDRIVFCARPEGHGDIYSVAPEGGLPQRLTVEPSDDIDPGWSPDGKWIYFNSNRGGEKAIWKIPVEGGEAVKAKGRELGKSADEKWVYYSGVSQGVWRESVQGGKEYQSLRWSDHTHDWLSTRFTL